MVTRGGPDFACKIQEKIDLKKSARIGTTYIFLPSEIYPTLSISRFLNIKSSNTFGKYIYAFLSSILRRE